MFLSRLILNPRDRHVRRDLASAYELHSTLSRAFVVSPEQKPDPFLWRLESGRHLTPLVLVQSRVRPAWNALGERFPTYVSDALVKPYAFLDGLQTNQLLRFRLRANPTVTREGKRLGFKSPDDQLAWLRRQGERCGFSILGCELSQPDFLRVRQRKENGNLITVQVVTYDGVLRINDPVRLRAAVETGLGHAKALGLGLLSVAPTRE